MHKYLYSCFDYTTCDKHCKLRNICNHPAYILSYCMRDAINTLKIACPYTLIYRVKTNANALIKTIL